MASSESETQPAGAGPRVLWVVLFIAAAAIAMGLPTLYGGFVGGDDHRLALDHLLVNHPSLAHAVELFTIWHRDLYQPLPLLSFQIEFAIADLFGLFAKDVAGGAWLFHLTNILLHAANAVLVFAVVRRLHERIDSVEGTDHVSAIADLSPPTTSETATAVATVAALLFAVHPLQTEVVAWTNGRMMLMSTLFALLAMRGFADWLDRPRRRLAAIIVLFVLLCGLSKVRIGLPVLMAIVVLARRAPLRAPTVALWLVSSFTTGVFVVVNFISTADADLFSAAAEHLKGPRLARVILALGNYFQHLVWPVGLGSYYPTPPLVHWSDPGTLRGAIIVVPGVLFLIWACRRSRAARLGVLWFMATLAVTLPIIPARNVLAADRYMYLPIIGLAWLIGEFAVGVFRRLAARLTLARARVLLLVPGGAVCVFGIGMSWHVARFYSTPRLKTQRIADLFPDSPRVWERLGWSSQGDGDYAFAIECAQKALKQSGVVGQSGAYQLWGTTELKLGHVDEGLRLLHKALEIDPDGLLAPSRLGTAYDELGRDAEAIRYYERAIAVEPRHNPTVIRLAGVYRRLGRQRDARAMYEKAVATNPYEMSATMGLVELDIERGTPDSLRAAETRLTELLAWMPESLAAMTNLGAVRQKLGRTSAAVATYVAVLQRDPANVLAMLNLGEIYRSLDRSDEAEPLFERAARDPTLSVTEALAVDAFYVARSRPSKSVTLWTRLADRFPESPVAPAMLAWSRALSGEWLAARRYANARRSAGNAHPLLVATLAYLNLAEDRYAECVTEVERLAKPMAEFAAVRRRLLGALAAFDAKKPDVAWTFCVAARLLIADGNLGAAGASVDLCEQRCDDQTCRAEVAELRARLAGAASP